MPTNQLEERAFSYLDRGEGPHLPLVCVHGLGGSKEDFAEVLDALSGDRRVVALDLPGHGQSDHVGDPDAYALPRLADWLLRACDRLGLDELHLLGHSLGGLVAQRAAVMASQRLASLVLADSGLGALREEPAERIVRVALSARDEGLAAAFELLARREPPGAVRVSPSPRRRAFERERFLAMDRAAVIGGARSLLAATPAGAFLRGIDLPVLVVHGADDDVWLPSDQDLLARTVRGARRSVVEGAGHTPQLENPSGFVAAVAPFLAAAEDRDSQPYSDRRRLDRVGEGPRALARRTA